MLEASYLYASLKKRVFTEVMNFPTVSDVRISRGNLFHSLGPKTLKARSPDLTQSVLGTSRNVISPANRKLDRGRVQRGMSSSLR